MGEASTSSIEKIQKIKVRLFAGLFLTFLALTGVNWGLISYNGGCVEKIDHAIGTGQLLEDHCLGSEISGVSRSEFYQAKANTYFRLFLISNIITFLFLSAFITAYATRYGANAVYKRRITILALMSVVLLIVFRVLYELSYVYSPHNENHLWNSIYYISFWGCAITFLISFIASVAAVIYRVEYRSK